MIVSGLVSVTCKTLTTGQVVEAMGDLHLSFVEWSEGWHLEAGAVDQAQAIRLLCEEHKIAIVGYGSYFKLGSGVDPMPSLRSAQALGSPSMRIWAGAKPSSEIDAYERKILVDELAYLCELAKPMGLQIALEWHKNTLTDTNESALDLLTQVDKQNLATLWQPTQALNEAQRLDGLVRIHPYLAYLHVYHWDRRGRRPLKEGEEQWAQYLKATMDKGRKTAALLEFVQHDDLQQLSEDAQTLNEWIAELKKE